MNPRNQQLSIEDTAAQWIVRRDAGLSPEEERAFAAWRESDPRHAAALAGYDGMWTALDRPRTAGRTSDVAAAMNTLRRKRRRARVRRSTAALVALACLGFAFWPRAKPSVAAPADPAVARMLAPQRQALADGSVIVHPGNAEFAIAFSARRREVTLRRGQAHFEVAKDAARPFVVVADGVEVRAVGTAFAVDVSAAAVEVVVTHGRVALAKRDAGAAAAGEPLMMTAGQSTRIDLSAGAVSPAVAALSERELRERLAWRTVRAEFSQTPLGAVIATVNAQLATGRGGRFEIADPAVAEIALSGIFQLDDTEALAHVLEQSFGILADRDGERIVLRKSPQGPRR